MEGEYFDSGRLSVCFAKAASKLASSSIPRKKIKFKKVSKKRKNQMGMRPLSDSSSS